MSCFTVCLENVNETLPNAASLPFADLAIRLKNANKRPIKEVVIEEISVKTSSVLDIGGDDILFDINDPELDVKCPTGHTCIHVDQNQNGRKNELGHFVSRTSLMCDGGCKTSMKNCGEFYSCISCDYDICNNCAKKEAKKRNESSLS